MLTKDNTYKNQKKIEYEKLLKEREEAILNFCLDTHNIKKYQYLIQQELQKGGAYSHLALNTLYDCKGFINNSHNKNKIAYFYNKESMAAFISWLNYKQIPVYITFYWEQIQIDSTQFKGMSVKELAKLTKLEYIKAEKTIKHSNITYSYKTLYYITKEGKYETLL